MKRFPPAIYISGGVLLVTIAWALGFVMGNASGTRRTTVMALSKEVELLKQIRSGRTDRAEGMAEIFVATDYQSLTSGFFWWSAVGGYFQIDDDEIFKSVSSPASAITADYLKRARSVDEILEEALKKETPPP